MWSERGRSPWLEGMVVQGETKRQAGTSPGPKEGCAGRQTPPWLFKLRLVMSRGTQGRAPVWDVGQGGPSA